MKFLLSMTILVISGSCFAKTEVSTDTKQANSDLFYACCMGCGQGITLGGGSGGAPAANKCIELCRQNFSGAKVADLCPGFVQKARAECLLKEGGKGVKSQTAQLAPKSQVTDDQKSETGR